MGRIFQWMCISILLTNFACKEKSLQLDEQELIGAWNGIDLKIKGNSVKMPEREPVLAFSDSNQVTGFAGCNSFFGTYKIENNHLQILPGGTTMAFCPDMEFEDLFIRVLSSVSTAKIYDSQLELSNKSGDTVLVFSSFCNVGMAKDERGCNGAAGYVWSDIKKECVRLFDSGVRLNPVIRDSSSAVLSAFLIFSPDSLQVELFIPDVEIHPILDRRILPDSTFVWNMEDDDTPNVHKKNGAWSLSKRGTLLYTEEKPIPVVYIGGDGKTRRFYQVNVTFYSEEKKAVLQYDDQMIELPQKISGSGFLYELGTVSLRGKGRDATLVLGDSLTLTLTQKNK